MQKSVGYSTQKNKDRCAWADQRSWRITPVFSAICYQFSSNKLRRGLAEDSQPKPREIQGQQWVPDLGEKQ